MPRAPRPSATLRSEPASAVELDMAPKNFNAPEKSERRKRHAAARELYLTRCRAQQRINPSDRAGVTLRVQRNMVQRLKDAVAA